MPESTPHKGRAWPATACLCRCHFTDPNGVCDDKTCQRITRSEERLAAMPPQPTIAAMPQKGA